MTAIATAIAAIETIASTGSAPRIPVERKSMSVCAARADAERQVRRAPADEPRAERNKAEKAPPSGIALAERYQGEQRNADDDPTVDRPRTLCFDCFRMEMDRRRSVAAQLARGWNATQTELPLADRLEALARRRGRAQIAARHALNLR